MRLFELADRSVLDREEIGLPWGTRAYLCGASGQPNCVVVEVHLPVAIEDRKDFETCEEAVDTVRAEVLKDLRRVIEDLESV
jgi:hypothetical protein